MANFQTTGRRPLDPDPFGGDPEPWWRGMFKSRQQSVAARRMTTVGAVIIWALGLQSHHLAALVPVILLLWLVPWIFERRARERRRRAGERLMPGGR